MSCEICPYLWPDQKFFLEYFPKRVSSHRKLASNFYGYESSSVLFEFLIFVAFFCFLSPLAFLVVTASMSLPPCSDKWSSSMPHSEMLFLGFSFLPFRVCPGLWHKCQESVWFVCLLCHILGSVPITAPHHWWFHVHSDICFLSSCVWIINKGLLCFLNLL